MDASGIFPATGKRSPNDGAQGALGGLSAATEAAQRLFDLALQQDAGASVTYSSGGRVLILGAGAPAVDAAARLEAAGLTPLVLPRPAARDSAHPGAGPESLSLRGHLGAFHLRLPGDGSQSGRDEAPFDLVLDLGSPPLLTAEVPPPGYLAPGADPVRLERALNERVRPRHDVTSRSIL